MKNIGRWERFRIKLNLSIGSIDKKQELYQYYLDLLHQTNKEQDKKEIEQIVEDITESILKESDENKIKNFHKINVDYLKLKVLNSLQNVEDTKMVELISQLANDDLKMRALVNIKNPDILMNQFETIAADDRTFRINYPTIQVISNRLETDEQKIAFLRKWPRDDSAIFDDAGKTEIILGMGEPYVLEALDYIVDKTNIVLLLPEEIRIKAVEKLEDDREKAVTISSLSSKYEEQKVALLQDIQGDEARRIIIAGLQDEDIKLELLSTLESDFCKDSVLKTISESHVTTFIKENSNVNYIKTLLRYAILDDEILEIIGDNYSLDGNQQQTVKKLYQKNNDLLKTINYEILDEKYSKLDEKLPLITCYTDIQEKICGLDENALQALFKTLNIYDEKDTNWIDITDKIVDNLYSEEYKELSTDIANKQLTKEQLEKIGPILSKENYFNISSIEEVERYEEIEQEILDSIIEGNTQVNLKQYPKIMEMKDDEKVKFAVLMSVYGQSLTEAKTFIEQYATDIHNLEITESNEQFVKYIYSLRTVVETKDLDILKQMYTDSKTMPKMKVEELDRIKQGLNDTYLETYNEKLFKPKEENMIGSIKVGDKEVKVFDAGTEFNISLSSIGAFHKNEEREEYRQDWNRPQIASQGFCTSYIRNDMLATAGVDNVVYGFTDYDKGSLIAAGPMDLSSDAARFRPVAKKGMSFLTENTMINESRGGNLWRKL